MRHPSTARAYCAPLTTAFTLAVLLTGLAAPAWSQEGPEVPVKRGAELVEVVVPFVFEGNLKSLPLAPEWKPGDPIKEIPRRHFPRPGSFTFKGAPAPGGPDPLLEIQAAAPKGFNKAFTTPDLNFDGDGFSGVNPPDTVGDVGTNYYIQAINGSTATFFTVHNKSDGSIASGPTALESLAGGSGFCANGVGDPIVLYDQLAGRWLLSEFSSSGNRMCVYISQTGDPISGGWYAYDFSATNFPDYPKYAVWPDAYYVGTNENNVAAYAMERAEMLLGNPAGLQRFTAPDLGGFGFQMITPADNDGATPAPAGAPAYFLRHNDDESHGGSTAGDFLEIFELSVDWGTPANSTFTGPTQISVAEFDSNLCGLTSFNCIDQPGTTTQLDPLREVTMWRNQYRNFGSHQVIVGNYATDVSGGDDAGVRWFELRNTGGGWTLFQEGTYAGPTGFDGTSRWMGSAAMDSNGNIALGYNVSSSSTFPGLRYAGRLAGDPAGTLPQGEATLVNGTASNASIRYGDYASMNVDPVDDCTFWFTGQYNAASQWSTRIGRFVFAGCGSTCGDGIIEGAEVCDGGNLGGETCSSQSCTGGTLACATDCLSFDVTGCSGCPSCDNDGTCETGEDCNNCSNDCISGTTSGASCGNGLCEAGNGEDCLSCPADCRGVQNGKPANRFCCGDGAGQNPILCSAGDSTQCNSGGFSCTDVPAQSGSYCCGDLTCEAVEDSFNCEIDCGPPPCGDGFCDPGTEDQCSCAADCGTPPASEAGFCSDSIDNDCGGGTDCNDSDCNGDPACICLPKNASCSLGSQCCSGICKNNGRCR